MEKVWVSTIGTAYRNSSREKIACRALIPILPIPIKCAFIMRKDVLEVLSPRDWRIRTAVSLFPRIIISSLLLSEKYLRTIACACISGVLEYQQEAYSFQYWVLFLDQHEAWSAIHQTYLLEFLLMKHSFGSDQYAFFAMRKSQTEKAFLPAFCIFEDSEVFLKDISSNVLRCFHEKRDTKYCMYRYTESRK